MIEERLDDGPFHEPGSGGNLHDCRGADAAQPEPEHRGRGRAAVRQRLDPALPTSDCRAATSLTPTAITPAAVGRCRGRADRGAARRHAAGAGADVRRVGAGRYDHGQGLRGRGGAARTGMRAEDEARAKRRRPRRRRRLAAEDAARKAAEEAAGRRARKRRPGGRCGAGGGGGCGGGAGRPQRTRATRRAVEEALKDRPVDIGFGELGGGAACRRAWGAPHPAALRPRAPRDQLRPPRQGEGGVATGGMAWALSPHVDRQGLVRPVGFERGAHHPAALRPLRATGFRAPSPSRGGREEASGWVTWGRSSCVPHYELSRQSNHAKSFA